MWGGREEGNPWQIVKLNYKIKKVSSQPNQIKQIKYSEGEEAYVVMEILLPLGIKVTMFITMGLWLQCQLPSPL